MVDDNSIQLAADSPEDLFAEHKATVPDEWHETFDELTSQGKSPSGIKATIEYVTTPKTQQEVAREFNVSEVTIRSLQAAVVALGPVDAKRAAQHGSGEFTALDYCTRVADLLGWEEGVEYSVTESTYGNGKDPNLRKEGWRALYEAATCDDEEVDG